MTKINLKVVKNPDEKFRILSDEIVEYQISRDFEIELEDGDTITVNKWLMDSSNMSENDWDFVDDASKKRHNKLSEDDQDAFFDFISNIKI
jgi:hypothetical protein